MDILYFLWMLPTVWAVEGKPAFSSCSAPDCEWCVDAERHSRAPSVIKKRRDDTVVETVMSALCLNVAVLKLQTCHQAQLTSSLPLCVFCLSDISKSCGKYQYTRVVTNLVNIMVY